LRRCRKVFGSFSLLAFPYSWKINFSFSFEELDPANTFFLEEFVPTKIGPELPSQKNKTTKIDHNQFHKR